MSFWDRYTGLCQEHELAPQGQKVAEMFGVTRAAISTWGKTGALPKGETLIRIADALEVSVDYLLERTDNRGTDAPDDAQPAPAAPVQPVTVTPRPSGEEQRILNLWGQLDPVDQIRMEAYMEGILSADKYRLRQSKKMG